MLALDAAEVGEVRGLLVTEVARTVVDVIGAAPGGEGLAAADAALFEGLPRSLLEAAVDLAGSRRGTGRTRDVVAFAHPGGESAAESEFRRNAFRLGLDPMVLQHVLRDAHGFIGRADAYSPEVRRVCEIDGARKYLAPDLTEQQAKRALYEEKLREDRMRAVVDGVVRMGFAIARDPQLMRPVLTAGGIVPPPVRPTLGDWARLAATAVPSRRGRFWQRAA